MAGISFDVLSNLIAGLIGFLVINLLIIVTKQVKKLSRRSMLLSLFRLSNTDPEITIYLSRHYSRVNIPQIESIGKSENSISPLSRLQQVQTQESLHTPQELNLDSRDFAAVAAVEMVEAVRLRAEIENVSPGDWLLDRLYRVLSISTGIRVNIQICPESENYGKLLTKGVLVFLGGPRSNLGAYYYLYGEQAGKVRPRRLTTEKHIIENIQTGETITCGNDRNLAVIQRHTEREKTLIYLAGTGIHGTAASVAYFRKNWKALSEEKSDFCIIIECYARQSEDLGTYASKDWSNTEWWIRKQL